MVSNLDTSNYSKYSTDVILKTTAMHARNDISFQFMLYLARNVQSDNLKRLNHNIDVDVDVNIVNQALDYRQQLNYYIAARIQTKSSMLCLQCVSQLH